MTTKTENSPEVTKGKKTMKIMFMGTPDFAKFSLEALYSAREKLNLDICAVVTQPDKPKGRRGV